jgi:hypothetical protein
LQPQQVFFLFAPNIYELRRLIVEIFREWSHRFGGFPEPSGNAKAELLHSVHITGINKSKVYLQPDSRSTDLRE